ncbi:hypothetical protein niasHT_022255 [Heterodera trifolii]|uniref:Uncharacterized protein n=1 Tax=Heterodera trifolii TaxID=157864 RepID=A0ABD2KAH2_9BILA
MLCEEANTNWWCPSMENGCATPTVRLLFVPPFTDVSQYLHELEIIGHCMHWCGSNALIYLAAAVSDFYKRQQKLFCAFTYIWRVDSDQCTTSFDQIGALSGTKTLAEPFGWHRRRKRPFCIGILSPISNFVQQRTRMNLWCASGGPGTVCWHALLTACFSDTLTCCTGVEQPLTFCQLCLLIANSILSLLRSLLAFPALHLTSYKRYADRPFAVCAAIHRRQPVLARIGHCMHWCGSNALIYLAAAVSDFYKRQQKLITALLCLSAVSLAPSMESGWCDTFCQISNSASALTADDFQKYLPIKRLVSSISGQMALANDIFELTELPSH